jgi:hypothetical protein
MTGRIWIWVAPLVVLVGAVPPVSGQDAEPFTGRLCVIDLDATVLGDRPPDVDRVQGTFDSRKLCTGGARPVVHLQCRKEEIENWPARNLNRRNIPCQIDVSACGLPGGLVNATSSNLTINSEGSARLQCQYTTVGGP